VRLPRSSRINRSSSTLTVPSALFYICMKCPNERRAWILPCGSWACYKSTSPAAELCRRSMPSLVGRSGFVVFHLFYRCQRYVRNCCVCCLQGCILHKAALVSLAYSGARFRVSVANLVCYTLWPLERLSLAIATAASNHVLHALSLLWNVQQ